MLGKRMSKCRNTGDVEDVPGTVNVWFGPAKIRKEASHKVGKWIGRF